MRNPIKALSFLCLLLYSIMAVAQTPRADSVYFDRFGNTHTLQELVASAKGTAGKTTEVFDRHNTAGIFDLEFISVDANSGFAEQANGLGQKRKDVVMEVFVDLSHMLAPGGDPDSLPLPYPHITNAGDRRVRVQIFADEMNGTPIVSSRLGEASQYMWASPLSDISHGMAWEMINSGFDEFNDPLSPAFDGVMAPHGYMVLNFAKYPKADGTDWNYDMTRAPHTNEYDLYSTVLHEALHILGFASLIDAQGQGGIYSPYDLHLKVGSVPGGYQALIDTQDCYRLNYVNTQGVQQGCPAPTGIIFSGSQASNSNAKVYTPTGFSSGSSLSHLGCIDSDTSIVMARSRGNGHRRWTPAQKEAAILCDLGYDIQGVFGDGDGNGGYTTYSGLNCTGKRVAANDDFGYYDSAGTDSLFRIGSTSLTNMQSQIGIFYYDLIANDIGAVGICDAQVIRRPAGVTVTDFGFGVGFQLDVGYIINSDVAIMMYRPVNAYGHKGNVAYVYVEVIGDTTLYNTVTNFKDVSAFPPVPAIPACNVSDSCNLVCFGDLEDVSSLYYRPSGTKGWTNDCDTIVNSGQQVGLYTIPFLWNFKIMDLDPYGSALYNETTTPSVLYTNDSVATKDNSSGFGITTRPKHCLWTLWCQDDNVSYPPAHPDGGGTYMGLTDSRSIVDSDGLLFELKHPLREGRTYNLAFLAHPALACSGYDTTANVEFFYSKTPPCGRGDAFIQLANGHQNYCNLDSTDQYVFQPFFIDTVLVDRPGWSWYTTSFTVGTNLDSMNYLIVRPRIRSGDSSTMVLLDNISISPVNTLSLKVSASASDLSPCTGDTVEVSFTICLDSIMGSASGVNPYAFDVGLQLGNSVELLPGADFTSTGQHTVLPGAVSETCGNYTVTANIVIKGAPTNVPIDITLATPSEMCAALGSSATVTLQPQLSNAIYLTKTVDDSRWQQDGDTLFYTIRIVNSNLTNPMTLYGIHFIDTLPNFIAYGGQSFIFTDTTLQVNGNVLSSAVPLTLHPGGYREFHYALVPAPGYYSNGLPIINCAYVTAGDNLCSLPIRACAQTKRCAVTVSSDTICLGDTVTLTLNPGYGPKQWSGPEIITSTTGISISAIPQQDATYTYTITDTFGGTCGGEVKITVLPVPEVSAGPDLTYCTGNPVRLQGAVSGAQSFGWSPQTGLYTYTDTMPMATPSASQAYTLSAVAENGCIASDEMIVSVSNAPLATITPLSNNDCLISVGEDPVPVPGSDSCDIIVCEGSTVTYLTSVVPGGTYAWEVIGGEIAAGEGSHQITVAWGNGGSGMIYLTVTDSKGCTGSSSKCAAIIDSPETSFTAPGLAGGTLTVCKGQSIKFTNTTIGAMADINRPYQWNFDDGHTSDDTDPEHAWSVSGVYELTLYAINACNCGDTYTVTVVVKDLTGPEIGCLGPVCAGGVGQYDAIADPGCNDFLWTAQGGTIVGGQGTEKVSVAWGNGQNGLGLLTLSVPDCNDHCAIPTTVEIPIVPATAAIEGDGTVCHGELTAYSLPEYPGTEYTWTVSGSSSIIHGQGTNEIYVQFSSGTGAQVDVTWDNAFLNCSGSSSRSIITRPEFSLIGPAEACTGSSQSFSAEVNGTPSGASFQWYRIKAGQSTSLGNGPSKNITFTAPGNYTVKAIPTVSSAFCNAEALYQVSIGPDPDAPTAISGERNVCVGGRRYSYGTAGTAADSYVRWTVTGGSPATAVGSEISVIWAPGSIQRQISAQVISTLGDNCMSAPLTVDIYDRVALLNIPQAFTGPDTICANSETGIIFPPLADRYEWSLENPALGSIVSGQGTNAVQVQWNSVATGQDARLLLQTETCGGTPKTFHDTVYLRPAPQLEIWGDTSVCALDTLVLEAGLPGSAYSWDFGDGTSATGAQVTHSYGDVDGADRSVTLTVDSADGCAGSLTAALKVLVRPLPRVSLFRLDGDRRICAPDSASLMISAQMTGYQYGWVRDSDPPFTSNPKNSIRTDQTGSWSVLATNAYGCSQSSNAVMVLDCAPLGPCELERDTTKTDRQWAQLLLDSGCIAYCDYLSMAYGTTMATGDSLLSLGCIDSCAYYATYFGGDDALEHLFALGCMSPCDSLLYMYETDQIGQTQYETMSSKASYCCGLDGSSTTLNFNMQWGDCGELSLQPQASHPMGAQVLSVRWHDGYEQPGGFASRTYTEVGTYQVSVLVEYGSSGCTGQMYFHTQAVVPLMADLYAGFGCNAGGDSLITRLWDVSVYLGAPITDWLWKVDNNQVSTDQHHALALTPGQHTVSLTVTANGISCTRMKTITVPDLPNADFLLPQQSCEGIPLTFADASTPANRVIGYRWDFGDGAFLDLKDGRRVFEVTAPLTLENFDVTLHIRDIYGCTDSATKDKTVVANGLSSVLAVNGPTNFCKGGSVKILPLISETNPAPPYSFEWSNGYNGDTLQAFTTGDYSVWVINSQGCRDQSDIFNIGVTNGPGGSIQGRQIQCANQPFTLKAPDVPGVLYAWHVNVDHRGSGATLEMQDTAGYYNITLTMADSASGCAADTLHFPVTVRPRPAMPVITRDPVNACSGPVTLTASMPAAGHFLTWDNGGNGDIKVTSAPGLHTVTASDSAGCATVSSAEIYPRPNLDNLLRGCFTVCEDEPVFIYGPFASFASHEFIYGGVGMGQQTGPVNVSGSPGDYTFTATTYNNCTDTAGTLTLWEMPCSDCEVDLTDVTVTCWPTDEGGTALTVRGNLDWQGADGSVFTLGGTAGVEVDQVSTGVLYHGPNIVTFTVTSQDPLDEGGRVCFTIIAWDAESGDRCTLELCIENLPECAEMDICDMDVEPHEFTCTGTDANGNPIWSFGVNLLGLSQPALMDGHSSDGLVTGLSGTGSGGVFTITGTITDMPPHDTPRCLYFRIREDRGQYCMAEVCLPSLYWPPCQVPEPPGDNGGLRQGGGEGEAMEMLSLSLAPNPAHSEVRVSWSLGTEGPHALLLTDSYGRLVHETKVSGAEGSTQLRLDGLAKGIYTVRLIRPDGIYAAENLSVY